MLWDTVMTFTWEVYRLAMLLPVLHEVCMRMPELLLLLLTAYQVSIARPPRRKALGLRSGEGPKYAGVQPHSL